MRSVTRIVGAALVIATSTLVLECSGSGRGGEHHSVFLGGVKHAGGYDDPLFNCVACHGPQLRGKDGPSCYSCHNNDDHLTVRGGVRHRGGSTAVCPSCHGPAGRGGLGPSCRACHGSYPRSAG